MIREMRRIKQKLTDEQCRDVLSSAPRGTLCVLGDDDYPYAVPIDYYCDPETGHIYFHCALEGNKIDAVKKNPKVSFNVLSDGWHTPDTWAWHFWSVTVFGQIRFVENNAEKISRLTDIGMKYFPDKAKAAADAVKACSRVHILELVPDLITGKAVTEK